MQCLWPRAMTFDHGLPWRKKNEGPNKSDLFVVTDAVRSDSHILWLLLLKMCNAFKIMFVIEVVLHELFFKKTNE